ncbi:hypothetical protein [Anthocerotibacter panamensis]|uniref:hypothetical protein n=1 Tax=Anthocerotibacter panamensis TaxID=2857077 RepID=UPI001C40844A|nr:hypothetical protein [Anthocerotibacter panamensis]
MVIILNKSVVTYCQVCRQGSEIIELGILWGDQPYVLCATFILEEERQANFYAKTCRRPALIVHEGTHYAVWCQLPILKHLPSASTDISPWHTVDAESAPQTSLVASR